MCSSFTALYIFFSRRVYVNMYDSFLLGLLDEIVLKYRNNGTIDDRIVSLRPDSVIKIRAVDLPPKNAYFGIVQAHSQIYPINLAHSRELEKGNNVNGTSIGILVEMKDVRGGVMAHLCNHQPFNVTVLVFILFYDRSGE